MTTISSARTWARPSSHAPAHARAPAPAGCLRAARRAGTLQRLGVRRARIGHAARVPQPGVLGPDAGIVEPGRDRMRLRDLPVGVLKQIGAVAVQDPRRAFWSARRRAGRCRSRAPPPRRHASPRPDRRGGEEKPHRVRPPPIAATSRSGSRPSAASICAFASTRSPTGSRAPIPDRDAPRDRADAVERVVCTSRPSRAARRSSRPSASSRPTATGTTSAPSSFMRKTFGACRAMSVAPI